MPTLGVAVSRIPIVRKPAAAATVTSSGGVVSSTVRCAREIGRDIVAMAEMLPQLAVGSSGIARPRGSPSATTKPSALLPPAMSTATP